MFTGIIEATGLVKEVTVNGANKTFRIQSPISPELKVDQSLSHNGVCLTVEAVDNDIHTVTAISETLSKTTMDDWSAGTMVNLERCMQLNGRLDGHIVQGHIDSTVTCSAIVEKQGSWEYSLSFNAEFAGLLIEKGSAALNGISLTVFNVSENDFTVAIIPYTFEHTNMQQLKKGDRLNIEFDMLGKYVQRMLQTKRQ